MNTTSDYYKKIRKKGRKKRKKRKKVGGRAGAGAGGGGCVHLCHASKNAHTCQVSNFFCGRARMLCLRVVGASMLILADVPFSRLYMCHVPMPVVNLRHYFHFSSFQLVFFFFNNNYYQRL